MRPYCDRSVTQTSKQTKATLDKTRIPNREDLCSPTSIYSQASAVLPWQQSKLGEYRQLNLLNSTQMQLPSCDRISQISQFTVTSEAFPLQLKSSICLRLGSPAQVRQTLELEQDSTTQNQLCGEKDCGASALPNPGSLLWNSLKDLSIEDFEQSLDRYELRAIALKIFSSYRRRKSEQCTSETEFLSCPTLTSCSSKSSRSAGSTKCEKWWRDNGLVPAGSQLSAGAIALLMGYPEDWFQALSPSPTTPLVESAPGISQGELSHQSKLRSHCPGSCTCPSCQQPLINLDDGCGICGWSPLFSVLGETAANPLELAAAAPVGSPVLGESYLYHGKTYPLELKERCDPLTPVLGENSLACEVPLEPKAKARASGWLERYTKTKKLKNGTSATYPLCGGERDPDNPEHWYWAYRYEEKKEGAKSDNGYITRAVSLPRSKVEAVRLAIACGWLVAKILQFIKGKL